MILRLVNESRQQYLFATDDHEIAFSEDDAGCADGFAWFKKRRFKGQKDCEKWFDDYVKKQKVKPMFDATKKRTKTFHNVQFKSTKLTDAEWTKIQGYMTVPENIKQEDIRIYHPWLANNFLDRDKQRFRLSALEAFVRTLPGKPVLLGHAWGDPGEGIFFEASLKQVSIEEALNVIGPSPSKEVLNSLEIVNEIEGGIYFVESPFYVLIDNKIFVRKVDAGIVRWMSIGFHCDNLVDYKKDDVVLWQEYVDEGGSEALEGSFVWIGSQHGAANRKSLEEEFEDMYADEGNKAKEITKEEATKPRPNQHSCDLKPTTGYDRIVTMTRTSKKYKKKYQVLIGYKENKPSDLVFHYNKTTWAKSEARTHCKDHGGKFEPAKVADERPLNSVKVVNTGGKKMKLEVKALGLELDVKTEDFTVEETLPKIIKAVEDKAQELQKAMQESLLSKEEEIEELKEFKAVFGGDMTKEQAEAYIELAEASKEVSDELREDLETEVIKWGRLAKLIEKEKVDERVEALKKLSIEDLKNQLKEYQTAYDKSHPNAGVLRDTELENEDKEVNSVPDCRYSSED